LGPRILERQYYPCHKLTEAFSAKAVIMPKDHRYQQ
jgi:hypothetical protein